MIDKQLMHWRSTIQVILKMPLALTKVFKEFVGKVWEGEIKCISVIQNNKVEIRSASRAGGKAL